MVGSQGPWSAPTPPWPGGPRDALSSLSALAGLVAGARGDPVAGIAVTLFICHVGYEVTKDVVHRLLAGVCSTWRATRPAGRHPWLSRLAQILLPWIRRWRG